MSPESYRKKVEEARLVSVLWLSLIDSLKQRIRENVNEKDVAECRGEALALRNFAFDKAGLRWSFLSGVVGAVVFRQARMALRLRLWRRSQQQRNSSYQLEALEPGKAPPLAGNPFRSSTNAGAETSQPPRQNFLLRAILLLGDIYVGGLVTFGVLNNYYLPQAAKTVLSLLETVPLVEGRSPLSDAACDDIVLELQKNTALLQHGVEHPSLKSFMTFASNCQRRRAYEVYLRREQGLAEDETVLVPPPGVPPDFQGYDTGGAGYGGEGQQQFQNDEEFYTDDQDWAASYTEDQEEDNARRKKQ